MLSRKEWENLANDGVKSFADLCLFVHLHVQPIGHLVIHDVVPLHFGFLLGQLLTFQLKRVILVLDKVELLLDSFASLCDPQLEGTPTAARAGVDGVPVGAWVHAARQLAANNLASSFCHTTLPPRLEGSSLLSQEGSSLLA